MLLLSVVVIKPSRFDAMLDTSVSARRTLDGFLAIAPFRIEAPLALAVLTSSKIAKMIIRAACFGAAPFGATLATMGLTLGRQVTLIFTIIGTIETGIALSRATVNKVTIGSWFAFCFVVAILSVCSNYQRGNDVDKENQNQPFHRERWGAQTLSLSFCPPVLEI